MNKNRTFLDVMQAGYHIADNTVVPNNTGSVDKASNHMECAVVRITNEYNLIKTILSTCIICIFL